MMEAINEELRLHDAGELPNSYREWDLWKKVPRPKRMVLKDDFQRLDKSRPILRPAQAIIMHGFQEGEQP